MGRAKFAIVLLILSVVFLAVLQICYAAQGFAESLKMHYLSLAEEFYDVDNVGIVSQGKDVVIY